MELIRTFVKILDKSIEILLSNIYKKMFFTATLSM